MGRRYVFFRDPNGKASRREDGKYVPLNLLSEAGESSVIQADGNVGWRRWPDTLDPLLSSFIALDEYGNELNEFDTRRLVWKGMSEVAKKRPGTALGCLDVLKAAEQQVAAFLRTPLIKYLLLTSLSLKDFPARRIVVRESTIMPLKKRPYQSPKKLQAIHADETGWRTSALNGWLWVFRRELGRHVAQDPDLGVFEGGLAALGTEI